MAIGDRIPTELIQPTVLTTTATTVYTNTGVSYRTQATKLYLCNTGASQRVITVFKNGLTVGNQILNSVTLPANTSTILDVSLVLTGSQTIGAKQDAGTDVNIALYGIVEQIA